MNAWRLLSVETHDAFKNMAIDEAVFRARIENLVPDTLRFYQWRPSAVSIGKFQSLENEVQMENCEKQGVDVVRRITGGGTVYHGAEDELTYSVIARKEDLGTEDISAIYATIYSGMAEALKILGITADFSEGNIKLCPNLTVNGRKISGSAQCHKGGVVLQHGTLLVKVSLEKMFTFLRVPWAKTCLEVVGAAKEKITSINDELGRGISMTEIGEALNQGFKKALKVKLVDGQLTSDELELAENLHELKYTCENWNLSAKSNF